MVSGELRSGLNAIVLLWSFNGGEVTQTELHGESLEGEYIVTLDTSQEGFYELILIGIDAAGNAEWISDGENPLTVQVVSSVPELIIIPLISFSAIIVVFMIFRIRKKNFHRRKKNT